ncbi:hypothetical protein SAMN05421741_10112 [Paenimyroides ummariense]|uniref:Uncharacterized protein n=2 Tax=Paenimyroides ummariense TaxID=913024 RepID=A0A1I4W1K9_9FLAO|nr:hypothetical protein SAMN05421741_10112 [Paenimyroides ummariense]
MDQIQQIVYQLTEKEVVGNNNISNNLAGDVAKETGNSLMEGLQNAVSGGNMGELMNMFGGSDANSLTSNPIVKNIIESLTSKLGANVGLDAGISGSFASSIIPQILSMVMGKAKSGDFNITDILGSLTGGNATSILDQNGDGKLGIDDALSAVKNGNLGDLLGGFFKK